MGKAKFSDDFKRDAVHQITVRGYPVVEVFRRLGVSAHSLNAWVKKFSKSSSGDDDEQAVEIRRLNRELARVTEERDILKKGKRLYLRMTGMGETGKASGYLISGGPIAHFEKNK